MVKRGTLLIVDDNKSILSALKILLSNIFENVLIISSPNQLISAIRQNSVNVVLLDMNFSSGVNNGNEGLYWLSEIKKNFPKGCEVVLFTAYADIELAINGMKIGACDFVVKPWDNTKLINSLRNAYEFSKLATTNVSKLANKPIIANQTMFWGESKKMRQLKELIEKVSITDANILIIGENGTGKEVLAREIHSLSNRAIKDMVTVDMGALTETLFESELFGHVKGAFTDAKVDREGKFELADNSTLFLDEIGNIPLHLQSKLLTVLQTRKVVRVGGNTPIDINIRIISATNQNIGKMVDEEKFRMDLMYRINTITVELIPLRERSEDIIPLANRFLETYNKKYNKKIVAITPEAEIILTSHYWNGNIRELQHTIEKAVIICSSNLLKPEDFVLNKSAMPHFPTEQESTLEEMERKMILGAVEKYESNLSLVASALGISRQTLYNKMKKYNI